MFEPLALRLRDAFRPVAVDLRGHGGTDTPAGRDGFGFALMAADVLAVLDHLGIDSAVALGQSLGGGVTVLVDELRPALLRRVLLCEPVAFSPDAMASRPLGEGPGDGGNFMSQIARKRRAVWPDRDAVLASYRSRPPFDVLAPESLAAYVQWGFVDRVDGQVELACPPEVEAWFFECGTRPDGAPASFEHLAALHAGVTIVCADGTDLPDGMFAAQAERAGVDLITVPGTHFFVQEDTARAAALVREHLT